MSTYSLIRKSGLMIALGLLTALSSAPMAYAATPTTSSQLASIIAKGNLKIDQRLAALQKQQAKVNAMTVLSSADKAALLTQITTSVNGLATLRAKLDADKDLATAKADYGKIYTDYRIYMVTVPKVSLVKVADDQQATATVIMATVSLAQLYVSSSTNTQLQKQLQPRLTDVTKKATEAYQQAQVASAALLQLSASDYNQDHQVMSQYYAKLKQNKGILNAAFNELKSVVTVLNEQS